MIQVEDRGLGLTEEQIDALNRRLAGAADRRRGRVPADGSRRGRAGWPPGTASGSSCARNVEGGTVAQVTLPSDIVVLPQPRAASRSPPGPGSRSRSSRDRRPRCRPAPSWSEPMTAGRCRPHLRGHPDRPVARHVRRPQPMQPADRRRRGTPRMPVGADRRRPTHQLAAQPTGRRTAPVTPPTTAHAALATAGRRHAVRRPWRTRPSARCRSGPAGARSAPSAPAGPKIPPRRGRSAANRCRLGCRARRDAAAGRRRRSRRTRAAEQRRGADLPGDGGRSGSGPTDRTSTADLHRADRAATRRRPPRRTAPRAAAAPTPAAQRGQPGQRVAARAGPPLPARTPARPRRRDTPPPTGTGPVRRDRHRPAATGDRASRARRTEDRWRTAADEGWARAMPGGGAGRRRHHPLRPAQAGAAGTTRARRRGDQPAQAPSRRTPGRGTRPAVRLPPRCATRAYGRQ